MKDNDSNKLEALYESLLTEKFTDPASEKKAKELEDSAKEDKDEEDSKEETSEPKEKEPAITPEKEDNIKKDQVRTKLAPQGSHKVIKQGGNFSSKLPRRTPLKEPGFGVHPYVRSHEKSMPEDVTGQQTLRYMAGKKGQDFGQEPAPEQEKPVFVIKYKFENKTVEDKITTPEEATDTIYQILTTDGYDLIDVKKVIETQGIEQSI